MTAGPDDPATVVARRIGATRGQVAAAGLSLSAADLELLND